MEILQADAAAIAKAATIVRSGGLVVMPTETVYGLAADATHGPSRAYSKLNSDRDSIPLLSTFPI